MQLITTAAAAAAKLLQSCPALCDPIDGSLPGSSVPGSFQQEYWSGAEIDVFLELSCFFHDPADVGINHKFVFCVCESISV